MSNAILMNTFTSLLTHESVDSEEDHKGLRCDLAQGLTGFFSESLKSFICIKVLRSCIEMINSVKLIHVRMKASTYANFSNM